MTAIRLVLDTPLITPDETRQLRQCTCDWLPYYLRANQKLPMNVEISTVPGPVGTWNFFLTEKNALAGALGHHGQENGYPAGWISPSACGIAKQYSALPPELWETTRLGALFGVYVPILGQAPLIFAGLASVLAHEIMEAIVDPDPLGALTNPTTNPGMFATDANGSMWLKEVSDHANSGHFVLNVSTRLRQGIRKGWRVITVHRLMVIADAALPSFYDLKGTTPFTFAALMATLKKVVAATPAPIKRPFDWVTGAYGWKQGTSGGSMSFFARPNEVEAPK